jgi:cytochrome c biogenesis factor
MAKVNPMVSWIWIATAIMGLGGILGIIAANRRAQEEPGRTPPLASTAAAPANR